MSAPGRSRRCSPPDGRHAQAAGSSRRPRRPAARAAAVPRRPARSLHFAGLSLPEVLLALALAAILAPASARLLAGSRSAALARTDASDALLTLDLAADLLDVELRRAGYAPFPAGALEAAGTAALQLEIHVRRATGDALGVRYLDDRLAGAAVPRDLRFEVDADPRGEPQLYRITAAGAKQPLVQGVTRLTVVGWADVSGLHPRAALMAGALHPWLLLLRVERGRGVGSRVVAVPLPNRPAATVEVAP